MAWSLRATSRYPWFCLTSFAWFCTHACVADNNQGPPTSTTPNGQTTAPDGNDNGSDESDESGQDGSGSGSDDATDGTNPDGSTDGSDGSDSSDEWTGYFPPQSPWYTDVSKANVDVQSETIISWLDGRGWGLGRAQIDFSIDVLSAAKDTPLTEFQTTEDFYEPDCDHVGMPLPEGGNLEGESGYACESDGDCHLIVVDRSRQTLYEMWRANVEGDVFYGGCLATWKLGHLYGVEGRGQQCTSADAAGYPIAPLLVTADEVAAGTIGHALRFILPNEAIREGEYVSPATHGTRATSGPPQAPPYGVRLRLRADYPLDALPNDGARTVARALQHYGMFLADGGNVLWTFQSDRHTQHKWDGLLEARDLEDIRPSDFEVIEMPEPMALTYECERVSP